MTTSSDARTSPRPASLVLGLVAVAGAMAIPLVALPDGKEKAGLAQFLGRFHPLVLHLPIGLLSLVGLMEALAFTRRFAHLRHACGFVLSAATVTAFVSTTLGWLLAWGGGYKPDPTLTWHLWGAVVLCGLLVVAMALRVGFARGAGPRAGRAFAYLGVLGSSLLAMAVVSHNGGSLTHGETFLTQHMPPSLRGLLGIPDPKKPHRPASRTSDPPPATSASQPSTASAPGGVTYAGQIKDILDRKCVQCHKPSKIKADLLMDSLENLMKGGESGPCIEPGKPATSELYRRITLDPDDEEFMPSDGKEPLTAEEVKLIERWIASGAR